MAVPKRRTSASRRDKRRAHLRLTPPNLIPCSNCSAPMVSHRVCPECGFYKGRAVLRQETPETESEA